MTSSASTNLTPAGRRWEAMVQAKEAQSRRLRDRDWEPAADLGSTSAESFRAGRGRRDETALFEIFRPLLRPSDSFVDVGAGAGRVALPIAAQVAEVVAIEPSPTMAEILASDAERAGLTNIRLVAARWQELPDLKGDVVFMAHALYRLVEIEALLRWMTAAARRWAGIQLFAGSPHSWLAPFWPLVHGEPRQSEKLLPMLVDVLEELELGPLDVRVIPADPFPLGPPEVALGKLRRRLHVAPGSAADARLGAAMCELLEERDGVLSVRGASTVDLALVRWGPEV
jgi:SAM-dependent methyltransferase